MIIVRRGIKGDLPFVVFFGHLKTRFFWHQKKWGFEKRSFLFVKLRFRKRQAFSALGVAKAHRAFAKAPLTFLWRDKGNGVLKNVLFLKPDYAFGKGKPFPRSGL